MYQRQHCRQHAERHPRHHGLRITLGPVDRAVESAHGMGNKGAVVFRIQYWGYELHWFSHAPD